MNTTSASHNTIREGLVAGGLGGVAVAAWFLIVDLVRADAFFTPARLGEATGRVFGITPMATSELGAVIGYTIIHFAGFVLIATVAAAIIHAAHRQPAILAGVFLVFVVSEVLIYGYIALLHATELLEHLTWVLIAVGNLIGAAVIAWKLWRDHPGLAAGFDSALGGRA